MKIINKYVKFIFFVSIISLSFNCKKDIINQKPIINITPLVQDMQVTLSGNITDIDGKIAKVEIN